MKEVYNAAWEDNWGFVPMTDAEMDFLAARLKPLLMEGIVWMAEVGHEAVGFLMALPDYNIPLKPLRGRLLTPKVLGFIPYLLGWKVLPRTRTIILGVKEKYRTKGLESAMLIEGLKVAFEAGIRESEASWILEDNIRMCRVLEAIGGRPTRLTGFTRSRCDGKSEVRKKPKAEGRIHTRLRGVRASDSVPTFFGLWTFALSAALCPLNSARGLPNVGA